MGRTAIERVKGTISSAGFASGDRFVVGCWDDAPVGPMLDVMWGRPDGARVLLAQTDAHAQFIASIYDFDEIDVTPLRGSSDGQQTHVEAPGLDLRLRGGRARRIPIPRPLWFTRWVEAPIARRLMQVEAYGLSPRGAREWYQATAWRWVGDGSAVVGGRDLGPPRPFDEPVGVGFSEPPRRPSIVTVTVAIDRSARPDD